MSRIERIGDATLYLGDCLKLLLSTSVDHVISDPPYEDELHKAMGRIKRNDGRGMIHDLGFDSVNLSRFDLSCRRIEAAYKQPRLFAEPPPKPVQTTMDWDAA